ncbi:MAG TPA: hypothetical protein VIP11_02340 [Gemmatimonadaceae bacterium]
MFAAATMFLLTLAATPTPVARQMSDTTKARTCVTPERTGTFRVTATKANGSDGVLTLLVLENIGGCLEATLVTDEKGPAAIDRLSLAADTLKGQINVGEGPAAFVLRFNGETVAGSIVSKKQEWRLEGRKTG